MRGLREKRLLKQAFTGDLPGEIVRRTKFPYQAPDWSAASAFVWHADPDRLEPVAEVNRVDLPLLLGIDRARDTLLGNTRQFARGLPANNALLWGARGMGKSSLVKAVHGEVAKDDAGLTLSHASHDDGAALNA